MAAFLQNQLRLCKFYSGRFAHRFEAVFLAISPAAPTLNSWPALRRRASQLRSGARGLIRFPLIYFFASCGPHDVHGRADHVCRAFLALAFGHHISVQR